VSDLLFIVLLLAFFAGVQPLELLPSLGRGWGWAYVLVSWRVAGVFGARKVGRFKYIS
jgi:hypothetical protein